MLISVNLLEGNINYINPGAWLPLQFTNWKGCQNQPGFTSTAGDVCQCPTACEQLYNYYYADFTEVLEASGRWVFTKSPGSPDKIMHLMAFGSLKIVRYTWSTQYRKQILEMSNRSFLGPFVFWPLGMTPANPEWLLGAQAVSSGAQAVSSGVQKCKPLHNCLASNVHLLAIAPYQSVPGLGRERECNSFFWVKTWAKKIKQAGMQSCSMVPRDLRGFVNDNVCDCPGTCADEEDWDCDTCVCPDVCGIRNRNCFCLVFSIFFLPTIKIRLIA